MPELLHEGDRVRIICGPFEGKVGPILSIDSGSARVEVDVFARDTTVTVPLGDLVVPPQP